MEDKRTPSLKNIFCAQPWVGLQVRPDGGMRPCCMYDYDISKFSDEDSIKKYRASTELDKIKKTFIAGQWPEGCKNCLKEEKSTGTSPRIFSPGLTKTVEWHEKNESYQKVELFVSNICNLDCIMCSTDFSSKWNAIVPELDKKNINYKEIRVKDINNINKDNVDLIYSSSKDAKEIILLGGEPFASNEILHFINMWSENECEGQLTIISNGTLLNEKILKILRKCKKVLLILSIDGYGKTYEWIRGHSWSKVEANILLAKKYLDNVLLSPTIGFHNIRNIQSLSDFCKSNEIKIKYGHLLLKPSYLSFLNLPFEIRMELAKKYENLYGDEVETLIDHLLSKNEDDKSEDNSRCAKWTQFFNEKRGFNFDSIEI